MSGRAGVGQQAHPIPYQWLQRAAAERQVVEQRIARGAYADGSHDHLLDVDQAARLAAIGSPGATPLLSMHCACPPSRKSPRGSGASGHCNELLAVVLAAPDAPIVVSLRQRTLDQMRRRLPERDFALLDDHDLVQQLEQRARRDLHGVFTAGADPDSGLGVDEIEDELRRRGSILDPRDRLAAEVCDWYRHVEADLGAWRRMGADEWDALLVAGKFGGEAPPSDMPDGLLERLVDWVGLVARWDVLDELMARKEQHLDSHLPPLVAWPVPSDDDDASIRWAEPLLVSCPHHGRGEVDAGMVRDALATDARRVALWCGSRSA